MAILEFTEDPLTGKVSWRLPTEKMPLNRQLVLNALRDARYADFFIDLAVLDETLKTIGQRKPDDPETVVIAMRKHGEARVDIDEPRMTATLHVVAPQGGNPITLKQCATVLKAARIAHGLDMAALNEVVQQAQLLAPGQPFSKVVARGTPPVNGADSTFVPIAPTVKDRILKPHIKEDGSVDYHELGAIPMVRTGDSLVKRNPPTAGKNGTNVNGEVCLAKAGKNLPFTLLPGAQIAPGDNNLLIAAMDGMPVLIDCGMSVEKVYQVRNVNASTGNVTFEGGVVVEGDVAPGFAVSADSDINISGLVDSARVVAGNDVVVNTGVTGSMTVKTLVPSAYITAGNTIWTPFAQFAELHANVGVIAMKLLLHCKISSLDWVKLGGDKPNKSKLMGGELRAVNMIKVDTLGDPSEIKTIVQLLGNFANYRKDHKALTQQIADINQQLADLESVYDRLRLKNLGTQQHNETIKRLDATAATLKEQLTQARKDIATQDAEHQENCRQTRLIITRKAYPGVEITIGDRHVVLKEEWGPGTVLYGNEGLIFNRGDISIPSHHKSKS